VLICIRVGVSVNVLSKYFSGDFPSQKTCILSIVVNDSVYVFGGLNVNDRIGDMPVEKNDLFELNLKTFQWKKRSDPSELG